MIFGVVFVALALHSLCFSFDFLKPLGFIPLRLPPVLRHKCGKKVSKHDPFLAVSTAIKWRAGATRAVGEAAGEVEAARLRRSEDGVLLAFFCKQHDNQGDDWAATTFGCTLTNGT